MHGSQAFILSYFNIGWLKIKINYYLLQTKSPRYERYRRNKRKINKSSTRGGEEILRAQVRKVQVLQSESTWRHRSTVRLTYRHSRGYKEACIALILHDSCVAWIVLSHSGGRCLFLYCYCENRALFSHECTFCFENIHV